jgi:hypothetical protein
MVFGRIFFHLFQAKKQKSPSMPCGNERAWKGAVWLLPKAHGV